MQAFLANIQGLTAIGIGIIIGLKDAAFDLPAIDNNHIRPAWMFQPGDDIH